MNPAPYLHPKKEPGFQVKPGFWLLWKAGHRVTEKHPLEKSAKFITLLLTPLLYDII